MELISKKDELEVYSNEFELLLEKTIDKLLIVEREIKTYMQGTRNEIFGILVCDQVSVARSHISKLHSKLNNFISIVN